MPVARVVNPVECDHFRHFRQDIKLRGKALLRDEQCTFSAEVTCVPAGDDAVIPQDEPASPNSANRVTRDSRRRQYALDRALQRTSQVGLATSA